MRFGFGCRVPHGVCACAATRPSAERGRDAGAEAVRAISRVGIQILGCPEAQVVDNEVSEVGPAEQFTGLPVGIENDVNSATYAEFRFGAGRDVETMIMLTLGTGCGGGAGRSGNSVHAFAGGVGAATA